MDVRRVGQSDGVHTVEGTVAGARAARLSAEAAEQSREYARRKRKLAEEAEQGAGGSMDDKFSSVTRGTAEAEFKRSTVGLLTAEEFKRARQRLVDGEVAPGAGHGGPERGDAGEERKRKKKRRKTKKHKSKKGEGGDDGDEEEEEESGESETEEERQQRKEARRKAKQEKLKKKKAAATLSFADPAEEEEEEKEEEAEDEEGKASDSGGGVAPVAGGGPGQGQEGDEAEQQQGDGRDNRGAAVKLRLSGLKNPDVDTSFLPDRDRDEAIAQARQQLRREWLEDQERVRNEMLDVTYSYWDGSGHRRTVRIRKGTTVGRFLEIVRQQLQSEFSDLRSATADNLLYVKEDLIIPHTYSFYDLIVTKARGKSGPLFHFDVHEDVRMVHDVRVEKDESHPGKVVERHWYERNKHIFPASRWEVYDPSVKRGTYTIHGGEVQHDHG